jgi:DNA-binding transcriptional LysR family regulator
MILRSGKHLDFSLEINDTSTLLDLVEAGLGVALIAEALVTQRRALRPVRLSGPQLNWTISAIAVARGPGNPAARELWQLITHFPQRANATAATRRNPARGS